MEGFPANGDVGEGAGIKFWQLPNLGVRVAPPGRVR